MPSYPNFVVSQVSTTDSLKKIKEKKLLLEKSQPFCLKMTYTFPKKYEVTKNTIFRLFIFFKNLNK